MQREGKAEWVKGAEIEDHAALVYRTALQDLIAGRQPQFASVNAKAQKLLRAGVELSVKADRTLEISIND